MSFQDMVDFLDAAWPARDVIVPCLQGPVGIGKTAAVLQHAENVKAGKVVTIIASQILPNEVSGITMPDTRTRSMEIYDHFRLASLEDGDILFFDELLEADQLVLSACLTLIESRQMMSGRKLPDIQIIAATNPTIKPMQLKENIRQRFVFAEFQVDVPGTIRYIKELTGLDITSRLANRIQTTGREYNILTPRSLTKMAQWMATATDETMANNIAAAIDKAWCSGVGQELFTSWKRRGSVDPIHKAIKEAVVSSGLELDDFNIKWDEYPLKELMDLLQSLPEWEIIERKLSEMESEEQEITEVKF